MHLIANSLSISVQQAQANLGGSQLAFNQAIKKCTKRDKTNLDSTLAEHLSLRGYLLRQELGKGENATVYLAKNKTKKKASFRRYCALVISTDGSYNSCPVGEIMQQQKQGKLSNVATIFDYFCFAETSVLVLELLTPLDTFSLSKTEFLSKFETAVGILWKEGWRYMDLKLNNMTVDLQGRFKFIDLVTLYDNQCCSDFFFMQKLKSKNATLVEAITAKGWQKDYRMLYANVLLDTETFIGN